MDVHAAKEAGRLAAAYEKDEERLRALRHRPAEVLIDVSGLRVFGEALPDDLRVGVVVEIRNELDRHLVRRCQSSARALRDLGVDMGKYPTETDPSLGDWSDVSDRKVREASGRDDPFHETRDARDVMRAKALMASGSQYRSLQGEILLLKVNLRRAQRGLPARAF
ncbi:hypothetical protein [Methylobacterium oryzae]|uniref:hypothetical protein n=1 Tax=Methylobacterium oryzae TaxID=334852 RepID=UPI002F2B9D10